MQKILLKCQIEDYWWNLIFFVKYDSRERAHAVAKKLISAIQEETEAEVHLVDVTSFGELPKV